MRILLALLLVATLSGCLGSADTPDEPPQTIRLKMWVEDLVAQDIYPGFQANLWAFCAEAADASDAPSVAAVEHWQGETCSVPGPTLRVREGDRVIVEFRNSHVHHHTIHWHGQHTPWESDGVPGSTQDSVKPGEVFTYDFHAVRTGTLWYHCHVDTQFHLMQGLYGLFIVEPKDTRHEPKVDRDHLFVLGNLDRDLVEATPERIADPHKDHKHLGSCGETGVPGCQNPAMDIEADVFTLNGVSAPLTVMRDDTLIHLKPGESIRLRILNAGSTWESLHPHGHDMTVTHIDGIPLGKSNWYTLDTLPIAPGQRYDVVIHGSQEMQGVWVFHTHVTSHVTNDGMYPGGMLTKIVYEGFEDQVVGAFTSEAMGGVPYSPPTPLPVDRATSHRMDVGTSPEAEASWSAPIERPCSLASLTASVAVDAPLSVAQGLQEVRVALRAGDEVIAEWGLGAGRYAEQTWEGEAARAFPEGDLTFELTGRTVDAVATFTLRADHIDDPATADLQCSHTH